jgi:predicted ester cyclase
MNRRQAILLTALASSSRLLPAHPPASAATDEIEDAAVAAKNAQIIRHQNEMMNSGNLAEAVQFFAEDASNHGAPVGRQGVLRVLTDILTTFPDWTMQIEDLVAIGDDVIVRALVSGTHKGVGKIPVNGGLLVGVPPTGKSFKVQHIHWYTLKDGLIVQHRANRDDVGMMQELGLLPAVKRYDLPQK